MDMDYSVMTEGVEGGIGGGEEGIGEINGNGKKYNKIFF